MEEDENQATTCRIGSEQVASCASKTPLTVYFDEILTPHVYLRKWARISVISRAGLCAGIATTIDLIVIVKFKVDSPKFLSPSSLSISSNLTKSFPGTSVSCCSLDAGIGIVVQHRPVAMAAQNPSS